MLTQSVNNKNNLQSLNLANINVWLTASRVLDIVQMNLPELLESLIGEDPKTCESFQDRFFLRELRDAKSLEIVNLR